MSAPQKRTAEQAPSTDQAYELRIDDLVFRITDAFNYAQGFDVAGWEAHLPSWQVRDKFLPLLLELAALARAEADRA